ncbi:hypothetical protein AVEN_221582-1 [Araneus ventricosus]|uniref:C2H2-type domain-containing protein n=1 Tax=Araneus ventricosus TaxID=182803 RepID=A0A4Y2U9D9_ARAVE|nr:hypothetical protein AVEN_221582-1 [Araneus ventricosus]
MTGIIQALPEMSLFSKFMSGDQIVSDSLPTSSPKFTDTFAGPSGVYVEAHRRVEDRHFRCPKSEKSNCRRDDFVINYRTHTGQKPCACEMCEKECTTRGNLNTHLRTHTEEKPYKCPKCGKAFTDASNRNAHYSNVHNEK